MKQWMRTCQECLHKQKDNEPDPNNELSNAYRNRKCKKCKSEALDYGSHFEVDANGTIVERSSCENCSEEQN